MTATEWLRKELETIPNYSAFYTNNYTWIDSIMNEAKEMEKEQIIDAYLKDIEKVTIDKVLVHLDKAEEYYETIKTRTNDTKRTI